MNPEQLDLFEDTEEDEFGYEEEGVVYEEDESQAQS